MSTLKDENVLNSLNADTTLEKAVLLEDYNEVKQILEEDPPRIDDTNKDGICITFLAAKTGNEKIVRYLVEYSRASMNIVDKENKNILHYAAMSGNVDLVKYLVEKVGMSPVMGDFNLLTPFDIAHNMKFTAMETYFETVVGTKLDNMYRNPIRTGMFPDPSIVRVGEDYYMANSSFIFFPCVPISHSKDLIHWKIIGHAIADPEWANLDGLEGGRGYWAPDISYYNGKFYVAVTYRLNDTSTVYRKQYVVSSDKPEGPYSKPAIIDEDGIDPSIFNDDDGRRYMLLNRGARIFELSEDATKQISKAELLYYGDFKRAPEGPHLLKKDGYYYLFEAEGGTGPGHRITVARSKTLMGNYDPCPYNPIMRQNDEGAGIQRCGHGKPVQTQNGDWYMVYLCGRMIGDGYSILGRETALDPITWTPDGWPVVNRLKGPSTIQIKPNLPECICDIVTNDDFNEEKLSFDWIFPRPPESDAYTIKDSYLKLKGSKIDLDSMDARNIVLRRQCDFKFTAVCKMRLPKLTEGQNAGVTCFYDENTYLKYGIFNNGASDELVLQVVEHIGDEDKKSETIAIEKDKEFVYFKIVTNYLERDLLISYDGEEFTSFIKRENVYYLCDEGLKKGKRFTGAMVGMYAYAGIASELYAEFDYFNYLEGTIY